MSLSELLFALILIWSAALVFGELAERLGQPAVVGELLIGILLGVGALGWIDPERQTLHLLGEIGVLVLLFEIGLQMKLRGLLRVGGAAATLAVAGVFLPFTAGYLGATAVGADRILAILIGATLTATSVGVTGRVFRDLGQLDSTEARIILGAAVIDDVLGLILLSLVVGLVSGAEFSAGAVLRIGASAVAFLVLSLVLGRLLLARLFVAITTRGVQGSRVLGSMVLAFALALLAARAGSAPLIGAFAAGLILSDANPRLRIEGAVRGIALFFVPIFFVLVGAQVHLRPFNPLLAENWPLIGSVVVLAAIAIVTKWAAGFAPFWVSARKMILGMGMVPRGEVGLIFAQVGRSSGVISDAQFGGLVLVVMITTFVAPIALRRLVTPTTAEPHEEPPLEEPSTIEEVVGGRGGSSTRGDL